MTPKLHSKSEPEVAVLVLNYNGKHHLAECLRSLQVLDYGNYEVFVVDNGSIDGSIEYVRESFPWASIIAFEKNLGFSKAYNEAAKMVDSDLIAFLNNDTKTKENWLRELASCIMEEESIVAVGSKMLLYENPKLLNHAGTKITQIGGGFSIGAYEQDCERYSVKQIVGAVCGGAMLVRRDSFLEIGGFDEDYFAYFEDTDFCWRAWLCGFKVIYVPTAIIYHKLGGSWGPRNNPLRLFLGHRNRLISMIKNFEYKNLLKALPISFGYDIFRSFLLVARRNINGVFSILNANVWVMINLRKILVKRILVQRGRKISDRQLMKRGLLATLAECIGEFRKLEFAQ